MSAVRHAALRLRRGLRRYGARGIAHRSVEILRELVYAREVHVWYELTLREERPRRELDPGLRLIRAGAEHLALLDRLWAIGHEEARRRLNAGGTLWLVLDLETPAFSCWTFRDRTPFRAAEGGWLELPSGTIGLEESMTSDDYRGRGVAPAAWTAIADALEQEPWRRLVTTIEEENAASRKAVLKIGFREVGRSETTKKGRRTIVVVSGEAASGFLAPLGDRTQPPP